MPFEHSEARVERIAGLLGVPSRWSFGKANVGIEVLDIDVGLPGVGEDGQVSPEQSPPYFPPVPPS